MIQREAWAVETQESPKGFYLEREKDPKGLSKLGHILDGVQFPNGKVAACWRGEDSSIMVYDSMEDFERIHVKGHGAGTNRVVRETPEDVKTFHLQRNSDLHGISGTGIVLDGVVWPNGKVTLCWRGPGGAVTVYDTVGSFEKRHISGHGVGSNEVVWHADPEG